MTLVDAGSPSPLPPYLREVDGVVLLSVKAQPRASRTAIAGMLGTELKIKIAAPPVDSAANDALVEFLARTLGCPRRSIILIRGQAGTHKQLAVHGVPVTVVAARLAASGTGGKIERSRKDR